MKDALWVGCGAFIGGVLRLLLSGWIFHKTLTTAFPWGTLAVNLVGCLLIGVVAGVFEVWMGAPYWLKPFLITGVLGGFTTFSAFGFETMFLLRKGALASAFAYVSASVLLGIALVFLGFWASRGAILRSP